MTTLGDCEGRLSVEADGKVYVAEAEQASPFAAVGVVQRMEQPAFMSAVLDAMQFTDIFGQVVVMFPADRSCG